MGLPVRLYSQRTVSNSSPQRSLRPLFEGLGGEHFELIGEVFFERGDHARISGCFLILREHLEYDHSRPPSVVGGRAEETVGALVAEGPVHPEFYFCDEALVVEFVGEWDEAVEKVWSTLPAFAVAAEPAAVWADVGPEFVEVAGESVGLDFELVAEPAGWFDGGQGERVEGLVERGGG